MKAFREKNLRERPAASKVMIECELCKGQFHPGNVSLPRSPGKMRPSSLREVSVRLCSLYADFL